MLKVFFCLFFTPSPLSFLLVGFLNDLACILFGSKAYSFSKHKKDEWQVDEEYCIDKSPINCPSKYCGSTWTGLQIGYCRIKEMTSSKHHM